MAAALRRPHAAEDAERNRLLERQQLALAEDAESTGALIVEQILSRESVNRVD